MSLYSTRRDFLGTSLGLVTLGIGTGCSKSSETDANNMNYLETRTSSMKLSLSVRVAEAFDNKEKSSMTIEELINLANGVGYAALCMRASQVGIRFLLPSDWTVQQ